MKRSNDRTLLKRIVLLFMIVCVIVIVQIFYSIRSLQSANESIELVNASNVKVERLMRKVLNPMTQMRLLSMELVLAPNKKSIARLNGQIGEQISQIDQALVDWEEVLIFSGDATILSKYQSIKQSWLLYKEVHSKTAAYVNSANRVGSFISVTNQEKLAYEDLLKRIDDFSRVNRQNSQMVYVTSIEDTAVTFWTLIATTVITVAFLIGTLLVIHRMIGGYIRSKKEYEKELSVAMQQANSANKAKSQFLANMSHEIRTPMNAILGFAEILIERVEDHEQRHFVDNINASGKALLSLINDILDLSKIEAGKLTLQYSSISVNDLFGEIQTVFGQKATIQQVELSYKIADDLPSALVLDETRLRQVLINLVGNALKFTDKGSIQLHARCVFTEDTHSQLDLYLTVEDTGIGIAEDQQKRIFEAFDQARNQKQKDFGGTGLGLAICQRLVDLMEGSISVTSELTKGSVFEIVLKGVEVAASDSLKHKGDPEVDYENLQFEAASILVVDDVDYNREIIKVYLEDLPFTLNEAASGEEALEELGKVQPDLILLDMKMPGLSGYDVGRRLQENSELSTIPVVAVTASALKQDEDEISQLCDGYLRKPVSKAELIAEIMKHLPCKIEQSQPQTEVVKSLSRKLTESEQKEWCQRAERDLLPLIESLTASPGSIGILMEIDTCLRDMEKTYPQGSFINWCKDYQSAYESFNNKRIEEVLSMWPEVRQKVMS